MIEQLFSIVTPVYLCIAVGFVWYRIGRPVDSALIADLCMNLGAPCLVFSSLIGLAVDPAALIELTGVVLAAFFLFGLLGFVLLRLTGLPTSSFLAPVVFPNTGNLGLPVCLFAFGAEGLVYGVVFFALTSLIQFTLGQWLWSGDASFGQLARTPLVYAVVAAVAVIMSGVEVPAFALRTTETIGGITIPLMQFTLGVSLASLRMKRIPTSVALGAFRLAMGFGVGLLLAEVFDLEGTIRGVVILDCAMPAAVINYLFAEKFERNPEDVAGVVIASTTMSLLTLPLILAWLL
ncbi:MAG: AEC family transporter [bacterium]|nr:AEC family transporter [bacterium]MCP5039561.1 AEC family transporter [bacterium]